MASELLQLSENIEPGNIDLLLDLDELTANRLARLNRELGYTMPALPDTLSEYYSQLGLTTITAGIC